MSAAVLALPAEAYVYVLGASDGPQKVGIAKDPKKRLASIQTGNPADLSISFSLPVTRKECRAVEIYAHNLLAEFHARGEWFSVSPDEAAAALVEAAHQVRLGNFQPEVVSCDRVVDPRPEGIEMVYRMLRHACAKAGSQAAFASEIGASPAYVSDVLAGRRDPGAKMLAALGIERVVVYRKVKP